MDVNFLFMSKKAKVSVIELILSERGIRIPDFQRKLNIQSQHWNNWKNRGIPSGRLFEIAGALGVSADELLKDQPSYIGLSDATPIYSSEKNISQMVEITGRVPLISFIQAGAWAEIIDNHHPGDAEEWRLTTARVSKNAFALRVQGDSMTSQHGLSIPEGSIVVIDPNQHAENGDIVVARLEDSMEATLKKLVIDGNQKFLKPLNPAYPVIPINGNCIIIGKAVKSEIDL